MSPPQQLEVVQALPPTLVATTSTMCHAMRAAYVEKLNCGVAVAHLRAPGIGHDFPASPNLVVRFPQCNETRAEIANWLKATLTFGTTTTL